MADPIKQIAMGKIKDKELHDEMVAKTKAENKVANNLWRFVYNRLRQAFKTKDYPASQTKLQIKVVDVAYQHSKISREYGVNVVYFEVAPSQDASKN